MKTLDVDAFHENIQTILDSIKSQKEQIQVLISQVQAFSSLDDGFKGKGGEAIRSFYETGHASFLTLYHSLLTSYEARLTQITHALRSFEPSEDGYITQPFLQDTIPAHLNQTRNTTVSLVDQANAAIQKVSHLASVSALNDQGFLTEVEQAKSKADKTMNDLVRFDEQQTQSLSVIQDQLTSLNSLLSKVKAGFQNGSIQPGNVSELSALAKKAMTDSGGVSVFEKGIQTTLTRKEKQEKVIKEVGLEKLIQLQAMTPAEQLKEIHKLEKNSPYIREVLTQIQQDTAPANMKKLAELSPAEQAVELEKSPYLQALNDSSTVGMLASQQILQNATGVEGMLMQSVVRQGQIRDVTPEKTAESFDFTEICENPAAKKEETGIKAVVKDVGEGAITLAKGTVTGTKGVAQDVWAGMGERADKRYNSLYDFGNYITMGGFDGAVSFKEGLIERGEKSFDSPYDFVNHATMGLLDVGQQALNTDKPLSKEHWENSMFLFASVIGGAKPAGAVKSVPKVTNVPRVPAHKATKTLSYMRNVVSPKAASNWSKKVYEPVQKKLQPLLDAEIPTLRPQPQLVGIGEALPGKTFGEALNGLTTYKMGNVSKGQSKALEKVKEPGGKSKRDVEEINDQRAVVKGRGNGEKDDYFIGTLKGEKIHLNGVKVEEIIYTKRLPEETAKLRKKFNSSIRKNFLKEFANDSVRVKYLREAGLGEGDIARMKDGLNPKGWQVHHNLPLDDGGTNAFTNLVLIKNDPYHKAVTNQQNSLTRGLAPKQSKTIDWPMFEDDVYPLKPFKRREE
ncbi:T7SS effector LXG polymorphic toxin [Priestia sp. 179-F W1.4 NHS]|uniref:T7SS effector LXG polymorphic toxin n=1 Tax=Priestia sp. 179-F W1.4 NHS TaxID=3374296 RepID=UPI0038790EE0